MTKLPFSCTSVRLQCAALCTRPPCPPLQQIISFVIVFLSNHVNATLSWRAGEFHASVHVCLATSDTDCTAAGAHACAEVIWVNGSDALSHTYNVVMSSARGDVVAHLFAELVRSHHRVGPSNKPLLPRCVSSECMCVAQIIVCVDGRGIAPQSCSCVARKHVCLFRRVVNQMGLRMQSNIQTQHTHHKGCNLRKQ